MADSHRHDEDSPLSLRARNEQQYERRQGDRRQSRLDEQLATPAEGKRRKRLPTEEVWWVIAAYVMMGLALVAVLLVK